MTTRQTGRKTGGKSGGNHSSVTGANKRTSFNVTAAATRAPVTKRTRPQPAIASGKRTAVASPQELSESDPEQVDDDFDSDVDSEEDDEYDMEALDSDEDATQEKLKMFSDEDEADCQSDVSDDASNVSEVSDLSAASDTSDASAAMEDEPSFSTAIPATDPETMSPTVLRERIQGTLRVLENWRELGSPTGRPRTEVLAEWQRDLAAYYGYSQYMVEMLSGGGLFGLSEAVQFFEANESPRPVTLRVNTLKTRRRDLISALTARGVTLEPVGTWTSVGVQVFDAPVPIGATPEYMAGHYLLQATSSLLPVIALDPQPGERVLDMSAAPGGKTTHIAALMGNTGTVFANDASRDRLKALIANVHRMGARNVVVCNYDGRSFPGVMRGFNRVLLDAPCSGTGVISKDPTVKSSRTEADFATLTQLQKELILSAIDSCDIGTIVYSTCSVTVEENEAIVSYALTKRPGLRLVETGLEFGRPGFTAYRGRHFHPSLKLTRRFYPHTNNMDGFFVAKFHKSADVKILPAKTV